MFWTISGVLAFLSTRFVSVATAGPGTTQLDVDLAGLACLKLAMSGVCTGLLVVIALQLRKKSDSATEDEFSVDEYMRGLWAAARPATVDKARVDTAAVDTASVPPITWRDPPRDSGRSGEH